VNFFEISSTSSQSSVLQDPMVYVFKNDILEKIGTCTRNDSFWGFGWWNSHKTLGVKRRREKYSTLKKNFSWKQGKATFINTHTDAWKGMTIMTSTISQLVGPSYFANLPGLGRIIIGLAIKRELCWLHWEYFLELLLYYAYTILKASCIINALSNLWRPANIVLY